MEIITPKERKRMYQKMYYEKNKARKKEYEKMYYEKLKARKEKVVSSILELSPREQLECFETVERKKTSLKLLQYYFEEVLRRKKSKLINKKSEEQKNSRVRKEEPKTLDTYPQELKITFD